jgi:hypothetical protein
MNLALWGGLYQASNKRKSFSFISSQSYPDGWNLNPHIELSKWFPICKSNCFLFEPFVMFDCANNWQSGFHEKGSSGFNIVVKHDFTSILRSEAGIRFYETFQYCWGCLILEEKASYVNGTPLKKGAHKTSFIDAYSSFHIETLSSRGQNHGVVELHLEGVPSRLKGAYASLDYQGEFGSSFQSHALTFSIGKDF